MFSRAWELTVNWYKSFGDDRTVQNSTLELFVQFNKFIKNYLIVLKMGELVICKLYLNKAVAFF